MLKNIPKIISPELLKVLCEMGHGDEIVIADGNFPAAAYAKKLIRADGIGAAEMFDSILQLIPLDQYDNNNFVLMEKCAGDNADTSLWEEYKVILKKHEPMQLCLLKSVLIIMKEPKRHMPLLQQVKKSSMQI